jgi:hypothetical protein
MVRTAGESVFPLPLEGSSLVLLPSVPSQNKIPLEPIADLMPPPPAPTPF